MLAAAVLLAAALASPSPSPSPAPRAPAAAIGSVTVVSGSPQSLHRAPQAASVLDARTLRSSTAPALDQALRALPGLDRNRSNAPFTNYGQLRLSFAGAGSDRGALFVDGVPAQDGFGGQVDWNAYPSRLGGARRAAARPGLGALRLGRDRRGALADHGPPALRADGALQHRRRRGRPAAATYAASGRWAGWRPR